MPLTREAPALPTHALAEAIARDPDLLRDVTQPALILDHDDRAVRWNKAFLELFPEHDGQIHAGEAYAENLRRFYRVRLGAQELPKLERYVADGVERHQRQSAPFEFLHRGHWLRAEVVPLPGLGRLRCWTILPPARHGDELMLRLTKFGQNLRAQDLDSLADGLVLREATGAILLANQRFAEIHGLDLAAQAVGRTIPDLLRASWGDAAGAAEAEGRWADSSRFLGAPFELPLPGDRWVRVHERRMPDGSLIGSHVEVTDLFRLRRHADAAKQRAEELAAKLSAEIAERKRQEAQTIQLARLVSLGHMATGVAHELNQPLAIMTLAAENIALALRRRGADAIPEALDRLEVVIAGAMRAQGVLDHLHAFGRDDADQPPPEAMNLTSVVEGALSMCGAAIRDRGITLHLLLPAGSPCIKARRVPLEQVVLHLLNNAQDAVQGRSGEITLAVEEREGHAILRVEDNGPGFAEQALRHGLEPFFTTKGTGRNPGLGLSLAYATVRAAAARSRCATRAVARVWRSRCPPCECAAPAAIAGARHLAQAGAALRARTRFIPMMTAKTAMAIQFTTWPKGTISTKPATPKITRSMMLRRASAKPSKAADMA